MTAQPKMALEAESKGPFVINLCSSTTPMALSQPKAPELKRFNFFVSRRRADGRDRFHLHMGHFMTLAEAEEWVSAVRDIYPGAWAGEAPGKKLAQRAAAASAPQISAAPAIPAITAAAVQIPANAPDLRAVPVARPAAAPPAASVPAAPITVPTLQAAAAPVVASVQAVIQPKPVAALSVAPHARAPMPPAQPPVVAPLVARDAPKATAPATQRSTRPEPIPTPPRKDVHPGSNVREVLKSLDDTAPTRNMPSPAAEPAPLSDTAVLKILEDRRFEPKPRGGEMAAKGIEMLRPDDTATVRALKDAVRDNEPVSFAVQLHWSVQPIDLAAVPPLAIFSAYNLYTVEGSRDGRKWYGLRLGFFTDAISAKQVASYVRSEFTSVAVIPVSTQERGRATENDPKSAGARSASRPRHEPQRQVDEFKLIDDKTDDVVSPSLLAAQAQMKPAKPAAKGVASTVKKKPLGRRVRASERRSAQTLEETLEILGAGQLEMDDGRGELLNDSGVRHLRVEIQQPKNSAFSRLLDRLSERVRKA
jgi:hypothetical protein